MEKKQINVVDSSISFVASFVLSQIALVFFAVIGIVVYKLNGYESKAFYDFSSNNLGFLISVIVMNLVFVLIFLFYKRKAEINYTKHLSALKIVCYIGIAVISYFLLYPVVLSFNKLFKIAPTAINISGIGYLYSAFSRVIIPAICEELLFRGIIYKGLENKSKQLAIWVSAIMFSIFHMSKEQMLYPLLMGLLFGVIMAKENNIIYCIIVHITNNALALTGIGFYFNHWTFYLIAAVAFVLFLTTILLYTFKNSTAFKLSKLEAISLLVSLGVMIVFWVLINFVI